MALEATDVGLGLLPSAWQKLEEKQTVQYRYREFLGALQTNARLTAQKAVDMPLGSGYGVR